MLTDKQFHFLSPEQVRGRPSTSATHQFSVAVALLGWVSGQRPFQGDSEFDQLHAVRLVELHPPLRSRALDRDLADVLERMLAPDPGDRFATVADARAALGPFAAEDDTVAAWVSGLRL
jgi:serine/threonine-protein kinase